METNREVASLKASGAVRMLISVFFGFCIILFAAFLGNIPSLYLHEGLPLFPALLSAQAMLLGGLPSIMLLRALLLLLLLLLLLPRRRRRPA